MNSMYITKIKAYDCDERRWCNVDFCTAYKRWSKSMRRATNHGVNGDEMFRLLNDVKGGLYNLSDRTISLTEQYSNMKSYRRYRLNLYIQYSELCAEVVRV